MHRHQHSGHHAILKIQQIMHCVINRLKELFYKFLIYVYICKYDTYSIKDHACKNDKIVLYCNIFILTTSFVIDYYFSQTSLISVLTGG